MVVEISVCVDKHIDWAIKFINHIYIMTELVDVIVGNGLGVYHCNLMAVVIGEKGGIWHFIILTLCS
jgi:hypothetical protein